MLFTMNTIILLALLTIAVADNEYYITANDYYDVDKLIDDIPKLQSYLDCYKDVGPCNELAVSYKKVLPEAFQQACRRCNPAQKHLFRRFLDVVKLVLPKEYYLFIQKYDPENKYFDALEKEIFQY